MKVAAPPHYFHPALGYSFVLLIWYSAWVVVGDRVWWFALINHVAVWGFLPLPFLLFYAARSRFRRNLLFLLPALLVATLVLGPLLIPHPPPSATNPSLRILSFNVLFDNPTPSALFNTIRSADADVVALQEVQPVLMERLAQEFSDTYPYSLIAPTHPYGTPAIFSRVPFQTTEILDLQADRSAVMVRIDHAGQPVVIVSAHLLVYGLEWVSWPDLPDVVDQRVAEQQRQARRILAAIPTDPQTMVIVACDCNSPETAGTARLFYGALQSSARVAGWAWPALTDPRAQPDLAPNHIDYIFYRGPLEAVSHYRLRNQGGSDHHPIVAIFS